MEFKPIIFKVGQQMYGVDISVVQSIEKEQEVVVVPNTAEAIRGIMNLRGAIVPIYSLRKKFGMPIDTTISSQYVIVQNGTELLGLEVDIVEEIEVSEEDRLKQVPKLVRNNETKYLDKIIMLKNRLALILNIQELLSELEKQSISSMIDNLEQNKESANE